MCIYIRPWVRTEAELAARAEEATTRGAADALLVDLMCLLTTLTWKLAK